MKKNFKHYATVAAAAALSLALLTGCGTSGKVTKEAKAPSFGTAAGSILLSVNPEIELAYNYDGDVIDIKGINDDGKNVVQNYSDYKGKDCDEVVNVLVRKIYESGYFEQTVGGKTKNIVLKVTGGSEYPNDKFLEDVAQGVRETVSSLGIASNPMTIDGDDMEQNGYIGLEKAKELVLAQLGLKEASFTDKSYELDDGVYELEFMADGTAYDFEVDAVSGKVLEADYEHNDDWDDDADDIDDDRDDMDDADDAHDDADDDDDRDDMDDADDAYDDVDDIDDDDDDADDAGDIDDDDDDVDDADDIDDDDDDVDDADDIDDDDDVDDAGDIDDDDDDVDDADDIDDDTDDDDD
ncbi:PepSY domain-containing protein [Frisingicoccus sp.]|uniref:PepSY domain-containing protein n=1 Tax=Frisingicoccus sp. TaxID=1918627 RepID=UPI003AB7D4A8